MSQLKGQNRMFIIKLFLLNVVVYGLTLAFFYLTAYFNFAVMPVFIGGISVVAYIWLWMKMGRQFSGRKKERLLVALGGNSFFLIIGLFSLYALMNTSPHSMEVLGSLVALLSFIVSVCAFLISMMVVYLSSGKKR
ncbi:hypothetical protein IC619_003635 [Hazenella sp. IB182353]|uniref:hypothetical protein n=1 Tax=Polycladospora coralii TaxID=2771432 RepID=UPI001745EBD6|nr:hypothetical protein [Polycladospora coralii]MBS7529588.1 hypothetical protein [Polycladospora coralii]